MTLTFAREPLSTDLEYEIMPLLQNHWKAIAHYQDIELAPDWKTYHASDAAGILRVYTARASTTLVGYAVFFVRHAPHYRHSLQAAQDILYLDPAYRQGSTGSRFIRYCDDALRTEGVQVSMHHVKCAHDFSTLLQRQGYEQVDTVWAKRLDRE